MRPWASARRTGLGLVLASQWPDVPQIPLGFTPSKVLPSQHHSRSEFFPLSRPALNSDHKPRLLLQQRVWLRCSVLSSLGPWLSHLHTLDMVKPTHPGYDQTNTHPALRQKRPREVCTHDSLGPLSWDATAPGLPYRKLFLQLLFSEPRQFRIKI